MKHTSSKKYDDSRHSRNDRPGTDLCNLDDDSSTEEIRDCIDYTRHNLDNDLRAIENKISPQKMFNEARFYIKRKYPKEMEWVSELPHRITSNPVPYAIIGFGMLLGGAALTSYALSNQRKRSGKGPLLQKVTERGKRTFQKNRRERFDRRVYKTPEHSRIIASPDPSVFDGSEIDQASTEEILRDQIELENRDRIEYKNKMT